MQCKTCKFKHCKETSFPCNDCSHGNRYEKDDDKCHPYERPYGSDERSYYG